MDNQNLQYLLALLHLNVLRFKDWNFIYQNKIKLSEIFQKTNYFDFLSKRQKEKIQELKQNIDLEQELKIFLNNKIKLISYYDKEYPQVLKNIDYPPFFLFYKGNLKLLEKTSFAIIGARYPSKYSEAVLEDIILKLKDYNKKINIVSGFARGIDTLAHRLSLKYGLNTIACLAYGLAIEKIYPKENELLMKDIIDKNSLLISEYHPLQKIYPQNFIQRNRLIAGLSSEIYIIEAKTKSGSLSTASFAKKYNKKIKVVPGNYFQKNFLGSHKLIKEGAEILLKSDWELPKKNKNNQILNLLFRPKTFNELLLESKCSVEELTDILLNLELESKIVKKGIYYHYL